MGDKILNIVVTGGSSGLGKAIIDAFMAMPIRLKVYNWDLQNGVDVTDITSLSNAACKLGASLDILINCAGINHLDVIDKLYPDDWDKVVGVNAKALLTVTQILRPELSQSADGGTICNIVSNASHMPMTHSLLYNASKGAAYAMTQQMARELHKTHGITVFGVSPNKLTGTGMSDYVDARAAELRGTTLEEAQAYQLSRLPFGRETPVERVAEFIAFLLAEKERHKYLAGCIIPYGL